MKKRMAIALLLIVCSCDRPPKQQPQPEVVASQAPSATELFDLQSKCTVMGVKIMEGNVVGYALTQDQVSHYNPRDNRCYVKLSVSSADLSAAKENYINNDYLYDGQSKELLAYVTRKGGTWYGTVLDTSLLRIMEAKKQSNTDPYAISDLVYSFVATDRKP